MPLDFSAPVPDGYRRDRHGNLLREENIPPADIEMDALVRHIMGYALPLSHQLARFRMRVLDERDGFVQGLAERYGARAGGRKGNLQLITIDGCMRVVITQAETVAFGPEIATARAIIDECLEEWCAVSAAPLRELVDAAFATDAAGRYGVSQLLRLRRIVIDDPRWREAQRAIGDGLRPSGRVEYVRIQRRDSPELPWEEVPLRISAAKLPPGDPDSPDEVLVRRLRSAIVEARDLGLKEGEITEVFRRAKRRTEAPAA